MNWKKWAPAVLAILLGGVAAMLARNMMAKSHTVVTIKSVQIVTATGPLMVGQEIKPENVTLTTIPAPQPPPDAFTDVHSVIGHVLNSSLIAGQNITTGDLAPTGVSAGLQSLIPAGKRAITINIDETNGHEGMLLPGCRIDILATIANGKATVTRPIVSNVLIQATGVRLSSAPPAEGTPPPGPYHTVTLIVTVHEAELIELASTSSRMRMLLRGARKSTDVDDDDSDATIGVTIADLTGTESSNSSNPAAVATNAPTTMPSETFAVSKPKWTVEIMHGAGVAPATFNFDMPRQKPIMVDDNKDMRDPAVPGLDERPER